MNIDHNILTIITFVPLAGAILLALLPDRDRIQQWGALAVTLLTFFLTLHLPFHYINDNSNEVLTSASQSMQAHGYHSMVVAVVVPPAFQFEQNLPWITSPAIRYHVGV